MSKTALITGATSGIGEAAARAFTGAGWRVIATGRRSERLKALVDAVGADKVHALAFDVANEAARDAALAALPKEFRGIDLLINNAGLALGRNPAQTADLAQWKTMIDTNVTALVSLTHKLLPGLDRPARRDHQPVVGRRELPLYGRQRLFGNQGVREGVFTWAAQRFARHRRARDVDRAGHGRDRIHVGAHAAAIRRRRRRFTAARSR